MSDRLDEIKVRQNYPPGDMGWPIAKVEQLEAEVEKLKEDLLKHGGKRCPVCKEVVLESHFQDLGDNKGKFSCDPPFPYITQATPVPLSGERIDAIVAKVMRIHQETAMSDEMQSDFQRLLAEVERTEAERHELVKKYLHQKDELAGIWEANNLKAVEIERLTKLLDGMHANSDKRDDEICEEAHAEGLERAAVIAGVVAEVEGEHIRTTIAAAIRKDIPTERNQT